MFDLGKEKITIECPTCNRRHTVTVQQVANRSTIKCSCNTNMQLKDERGSARRSINDINNSMKKLNDVFKKLGR